MWDPDLIFDTSKNYFTEHVGERVLAPTWGGYKDMKEIPLSLSYLQEAKRAGMKITPLLHNDFDLQETKKLLHDSGAVQNLARQITATALVYDFDGWNLDFENMDEQKLLNKQYKINNTLKNIRQLNEQSSLYELLKYRMINKGVSRSLKETHDLDDLVTSEISIVASTGIENFEIKKNHQLFQANYFITVGDYRAAFNSFVELNKLFEENIHLWNDPPVYYLMTVEGMLESLRIMHNYEGMDYFIEKLARLSSPSSSFQLNVTYVIFIYRLFSFIDVGNFKMAGTWVDEYQASLLDKILLLKEQQQAEISLYIALTHLGNGEYRKARKRLSTTIGRSHLYSLSLFRTIRIVNVMIHYELGDVDYIQSEVRSIKREMSKNKRHNLKVESFLLKFLNYSFTDKNRKKQVEIWKSVEEEIHALHEDKYEIQILRRFDFTAWVKAKIFNLSLGDVLSEKCNLAYK